MRIIDNIQIEYWNARRSICNEPCMQCKAYGICQRYSKMEIDKETEIKERHLFWIIIRKIITMVVNYINNKM